MSPSILIIDDHPAARDYLVRVLQQAFAGELDIHTAKDLHIARKLLGLGPQNPRALPAPVPAFEMLLIDMDLPDGSGADLLRELREHPALKIIVSASAADADILRATQHGADGYLLKDERMEVLIDQLRATTRKQPPLSAHVARRLMAHLRESPPSGTLEEPMARTPSLRPAQPVPQGRGALPEHDKLTPRESEVLLYLAKGLTIAEIAKLLGIRWYTVNDYVKACYRKLGVSSRAEAAVVATKFGLV